MVTWQFYTSRHATIWALLAGLSPSGSHLLLARGTSKWLGPPQLTQLTQPRENIYSQAFWRSPDEKAIPIPILSDHVSFLVVLAQAQMETSRFLQFELRSDTWMAKGGRRDSPILWANTVLSNPDRWSYQRAVSSYWQTGIWVYLDCLACTGHGVRIFIFC